MFYSINLIRFGQKTKLIRKNNNLSQHDVYIQTGLNEDSLRRIENGIVLPKLDTLLLLSTIYRTDLLRLFYETCTNELLLKIYSQLDNILSSTCTTTIIEFCNESIDFFNRDITTTQLVIPSERQQFLNLLQAIKYSLNDDEIPLSNDLLLKGLQCTHPDFLLTNISLYNFTELELRLLYLMAANFMEIYNIEQSLDILFYLLSIKNLNLSLKLHIKTYALISYNYFLKELYSESLSYANKGLELTSSNQTTYYLHSLLARKAVALKKLGQAGFEENMKFCLEILKFENNHDLIEHYKYISKERYGITL